MFGYIEKAMRRKEESDTDSIRIARISVNFT